MLTATAQPDDDERTRRIEAGLLLVRRIAFRMARRLPPSVEVDDLISAGTEGLLRAVDAYDPTRNERFEPYAETRIRGAILDELRASDSLTRYGRRRMGDVSRAIQGLERAHGRAPTEEEVAQKLGVPLETYQTMLAELSRGPALGRLGEIDPDDVGSGHEDPSSLYDDEELRTQLAAAIGKLPHRAQQVLSLYYQHECTQAEIGKILGVTESRVCQILAESAARLRAALVTDAEEKKPKVARLTGTRA